MEFTVKIMKSATGKKIKQNKGHDMVMEGLRYKMIQAKVWRK